MPWLNSCHCCGWNLPPSPPSFSLSFHIAGTRCALQAEALPATSNSLLFIQTGMSPNISLAHLVPSWYLLLGGTEQTHQHIGQKSETPNKHPVGYHNAFGTSTVHLDEEQEGLQVFQTLQLTVHIIHSVNEYWPLLVANPCRTYMSEAFSATLCT